MGDDRVGELGELVERVLAAARAGLVADGLDVDLAASEVNFFVAPAPRCPDGREAVTLSIEIGPVCSPRGPEQPEDVLVPSPGGPGGDESVDAG